jgi:4-amino-4-deoxy-L-arabinose transferase-like glycosyltransferase
MAVEGRHNALLLAIIIVAAALRLYGLGWGIPDLVHPDYSYHPDEALQILWARWLSEGELYVYQFIYGGTLHYTMLNAYHHIGHALAPALHGANELADAILAGRFLVTAASLLTVLLTYESGRRLFGTGAGLLGALLLALAPVHVFLAQNVRPDTFGTLLSTGIVYLSTLILRGEGARDKALFAAGGLVLGMAVALRAPLVVFGIAPVAAWVLRAWPLGPRDVLARLLDRRFRMAAAILAVTTLAGYVIASPHSLLHPGMLAEGLSLTWKYESGPFLDAVDRGPGLYQYGWLTLSEALGAAVWFLALAGIVHAAWRRSPAGLLVLIAGAPYFVLMTFASWVVVRYTLPLVPLLALLAAAAVLDIAQSRPRWRLGIQVITSVAIAWTLAADLAFAGVQGGQNVRDVASAWSARQIPAGAKVMMIELYSGDNFFNPPADGRHERAVFRIEPGANTHILDNPFYEYLVLNQTLYKNMERLGPRHPSPETRELQQLLGERFDLVQRFELPVTLLGLDFSRWFTSQDFAIVNPGIRIYRRR